jgi:hypothetical protein
MLSITVPEAVRDVSTGTGGCKVLLYIEVTARGCYMRQNETSGVHSLVHDDRCFG